MWPYLLMNRTGTVDFNNRLFLGSQLNLIFGCRFAVVCLLARTNEAEIYQAFIRTNKKIISTFCYIVIFYALLHETDTCLCAFCLLIVFM